MIKPLLVLLVLVGCYGLAACQQTQPPASGPGQQAIGAATPTTGAPTEAEARSAIAAYLQQQPNVAVFQLDSARFVDLDTRWQVMVPRTDWAKRMPNAAAFEVDKQTGQVSTLLVK